MMDLIENACKPQGQEEMARVMGDGIRATITISQGQFRISQWLTWWELSTNFGI